MEKNIEVLAYFASGYPMAKIKIETLVVYAQALADYNSEQLKAAMMTLLRTKKDFPSVAEICQALSAES